MSQINYQNHELNLAESEKLFDNKILDYLSRTHIAFPIALYLTLSVGFLFTAIYYAHIAGWLVTLLFLGGLFFWTFFEYVMHRFLYHHNAKSPKLNQVIYTIHGVHHKQPKDKSRLSLPPIVSIIIGALWFGIFYLLITTYTYGVLPGVMTGYAGYLLVHYLVHIYNPPKNVFKALWKNHAIHHYKDDTVMYGLSSPLWDYIFGTHISQKNRSL